MLSMAPEIKLSALKQGMMTDTSGDVEFIPISFSTSTHSQIETVSLQKKPR